MDIPPGLTSPTRNLAALRDASTRFSDLYGLTTRERDVMFLLASGVAHVAELAAALQLRPNTIHNHLKGIFRRTRTRSKSELLAAMLIHTLEHADSTARVHRRPQVLLLDECRAFAGVLVELGMRVHQDEGALLGLGTHVRVDAVVAPASRAEYARDLHARLGATTPLWLTVSEGTTPDAADGSHLPFDGGRVGFEILLALCDDPYARSRLTRVDADLAAVLGTHDGSRVVNLGFGGAFVALPAHALEGPGALRPGDAVDVAVEIGTDRALHARAAVVWTRPRNRLTLPSGVGVRFLELSHESRSLLEDSVRAERLRTLRTSAAASTRAVQAVV